MIENFAMNSENPHVHLPLGPMGENAHACVASNTTAYTDDPVAQTHHLTLQGVTADCTPVGQVNP